MSDVMLLGILRMPFDTKGDMHLVQLRQACLEAADRIEADKRRFQKIVIIAGEDYD
ncbi:MAG: hypothetical protein ABFD07_04205 [Methanobacterium sp.]